MSADVKGQEHKEITPKDLRRAIAAEMSIIFEANRDEIVKRAKERLKRERGEKLS